MRRGTLTLLLFIVLLAIGAAYVNFWPNSDGHGHPWHGIPNPWKITEGLDLQGGVQVLLVPKGKYTTQELQDGMPAVVTEIQQRVNGGLGVNEPVIRQQTTNGKPSISVELPGLNSGNPFQQINALLKTGVLEFWDTGPTPAVSEGQAFDPTQFTQYNTGNKPQFTGADLDSGQLSIGQDQSGRPAINFSMNGNAAARFGSFTSTHIGDFLTITLDRVVISSPRIDGAITGNGQITGHFTLQQAQSIVSVLRYGSLRINLQIADEQTIGPTLGQDSIFKSAIAAIIGLSIVVVFMILYYRLPGVLADVALVLYALLTFAIFKIAGVIMSLAGIAGFVLSIGMAVDANILIFERIKEELRAGRLLASAIDIGWKRAWPSIRDSNISTLITCAILFYFGSNFGASIIVGFASTLFIGVVISMFTAVVVTRTFLNLLVPTGVINHPALFGLPAGSIAASTAKVEQNSAI